MLSCTLQVDFLKNGYQRACVAAYDVEMDVASELCRRSEPFARLRKIRSLLGMFFGESPVHIELMKLVCHAFRSRTQGRRLQKEAVTQ